MQTAHVVVAAAQRSRRLAAPGVAICTAVVAGHGDRGRVVVELGDLDAEVADHPQDRGGDHAGPIGVEETIEHAPHPVVVERPGLAGPETEHRRVMRRRPLADGVERTMGDHDVAHDHPDHRGGGQGQASVVGQVGVEGGADAHAGQEVVDDRQASDGLAPKGEALPWGHGLPP